MIRIRVSAAMPRDALCCSGPAGDVAVASLHSSVSSLADLPRGVVAHVVAVRPARHEHEHELERRLLEIGFVAGEAVRVIAHGHPGREPIAVRVGGTTFALRRFEAERVLVTLGGKAR
jgi:ferrous iron transport protein A